MSPKIFVSFIPWLLFSCMVNRVGDRSTGAAALAAAALAVVFLVHNAKTGVKVIDAAGVVTFAVLAIACFVGGDSVSRWVADYGRATAALVLALIMLVSVVTVPFTEQYARESVPRENWHSPAFRAVNRKISAVWGAAIAIMAGSHFVAGFADPLTNPKQGSRPVDLIFNWVIPIVLILAAVRYTRHAAEAPRGDRAAA